MHDSDRVISVEEIEHWKLNRYTLEFATLIINSRVADGSRHHKQAHLQRLETMIEEITKSIMDAERLCECEHMRADHDGRFGCEVPIILEGRPDVCRCLFFKEKT